MISGRSKVGAVRRLCEGSSRSSGFRIFSGPKDNLLWLLMFCSIF